MTKLEHHLETMDRQVPGNDAGLSTVNENVVKLGRISIGLEALILAAELRQNERLDRMEEQMSELQDTVNAAVAAMNRAAQVMESAAEDLRAGVDTGAIVASLKDAAAGLAAATGDLTAADPTPAPDTGTAADPAPATDGGPTDTATADAGDTGAPA